MNFILILKELWQRRILVVAAAFVAAVVAVFAVYSVSFSPPSIAKRDHHEARGSIEILIDSAQSPIADVGRDLEPLTARAGVFARYMAGGNVIEQIAKDTGIPVKQIEVAGPAPLPGEAAPATEAPAHRLPYGIEVVQRDALPIVNIGTYAPSVEQAQALAAAAPGAIRRIVASIQEEQGIPDRKRVTFRVLGPAQADVATEANGAKIAVLIFLFLFVFLVFLILAVPRLIAAWRSVDSSSQQQPYGPPQPRVVVPLPAGEGTAPSSARALASASIAAAEEMVERAQLEVSGRSGKDG